MIEQFIERRKKRAMAQLLEEFEREVQPLIPEAVATAFKALARRKLNSFASDVLEALRLRRSGQVKNAVAQDIEDRLHADSAH